MGNQKSVPPKYIPGDEVQLIPRYQEMWNNPFTFIVYQVRLNMSSSIVNSEDKKENELIVINNRNYKETFPESILMLKETDLTSQRRKEYVLLQSYFTECSNRRIQPLQIITNLYNQYIFKGKPVRVLVLRNQMITDKIFETIVPLLKMRESSLIKIDLSHNQLSHKSCFTLSNIFKLSYSKMSYVNLSFNSLGIEGANHLGRSLRLNKSLHIINLENTFLCKDGSSEILHALLENEAGIDLVKLSLKDCGCGEEEVGLALKLAKKMKSLTSVDLYSSVDKKNDGWLDWNGWNDLLRLRSELKENSKNLTVKSFSINSSFSSGSSSTKSLSASIRNRGSELQNLKSTKEVIEKIEDEGENLIECSICYDDYSAEKIYILDECYHKFCFDCLRNWVKTKIENNETDAIKCPNCSRAMTQIEVKQVLLGGEMQLDDFMEKFDKFTLNKALTKLDKDPNEKLVWCPNSKCQNGFLVNLKDFKSNDGEEEENEKVTVNRNNNEKKELKEEIEEEGEEDEKIEKIEKSKLIKKEEGENIRQIKKSLSDEWLYIDAPNSPQNQNITVLESTKYGTHDYPIEAKILKIFPALPTKALPKLPKKEEIEKKTPVDPKTDQKMMFVKPQPNFSQYYQKQNVVPTQPPNLKFHPPQYSEKQIEGRSGRRIEKTTSVKVVPPPKMENPPISPVLPVPLQNKKRNPKYVEYRYPIYNPGSYPAYYQYQQMSNIVDNQKDLVYYQPRNSEGKVSGQPILVNPNQNTPYVKKSPVVPKSNPLGDSNNGMGGGMMNQPIQPYKINPNQNYPNFRNSILSNYTTTRNNGIKQGNYNQKMNDRGMISVIKKEVITQLAKTEYLPPEPNRVISKENFPVPPKVKNLSSQNITSIPLEGIKKGRKYVKCMECGTFVCVLCQRESHVGKTCEEAKNQNELAQDELFKQWASDHNTKPCPQCSKLIEKSGGCNHMTCGSCGCEFCWLCMQKTDTSDGHFKIGGKCPQWSVAVLGMEINIPHL